MACDEGSTGSTSEMHARVSMCGSATRVNIIGPHDPALASSFTELLGRRVREARVTPPGGVFPRGWSAPHHPRLFSERFDTVDCRSVMRQTILIPWNPWTRSRSACTRVRGSRIPAWIGAQRLPLFGRTARCRRSRLERRDRCLDRSNPQQQARQLTQPAGSPGAADSQNSHAIDFVGRSRDRQLEDET